MIRCPPGATLTDPPLPYTRLFRSRAEAVSLDQLMALAITDDHTAQEAAFYDAPTWQRSPHNLRDRLTEREIDAHRHPLVRFVGLDAYEAAGGGTRRDLFAERSEEHTSELQSLMRISYAVFCLKNKTTQAK